MTKNKATIEDVAKHAGFSKSLVSNYLNQKFETMTNESKEKIEQAISELNYEPNTRYRNFKEKKTGVIGLIIADIMDPFQTLISKGIMDAGLKYEYNILMGNSDNNILTENQYIDTFLKQVDGMIINSVGKNDNRLIELETKVPIVLLDRSIRIPKYDVISSDNYESMQELMEFLVENGYEAFGFFSEELVEGTPRLIRSQSYRDFVEQHKLQESSFCYTINFYDEKVLIRNLVDFMGKIKDKRTAIICANGRTLTHVLPNMNSMNIAVPEEMGICGYDDFEAITLMHNGITTVRQPTYDMASRCVRQVVNRINNHKDPIQQINLKSKLIIRGSV